MPRTEEIVSIFVASPSDLSEEREILEAIVDEINLTHARGTGIRLELLMWERDVSPAIAEDAQSAINRQIPKDYDVFIGMFWNTIGSPTARAESGTVEEYQWAKKRYDKDPSKINMMLYFKDAPPLSMEDFDPDSFKKVREFRSKVGAEAFYREFVSCDDFEKRVRVDLTKLIFDWPSSRKRVEGPQSTVDANCAPIELDELPEARQPEDEGYFELEEAFEKEMDLLTDTLNRMSDSIASIGRSVTSRSDEINKINASMNQRTLSQNHRQKTRAEVKRVMRRASSDMDAFVARMKQDVPLYRRHLDRSVDVLTKAVPVYLELSPGVDEQGLKNVINTVSNGMEDMQESMESFRDAVAGLPRLTSAVGRSRRETEKILQEVIEITWVGRVSLREILSILP